LAFSFHFIIFLHIFGFCSNCSIPIVKGFGGIYESKIAVEGPILPLELQRLFSLTMTHRADNQPKLAGWVDNNRPIV